MLVGLVFLSRFLTLHVGASNGSAEPTGMFVANQIYFSQLPPGTLQFFLILRKFAFYEVYWLSEILYFSRNPLSRQVMLIDGSEVDAGIFLHVVGTMFLNEC